MYSKTGLKLFLIRAMKKFIFDEAAVLAKLEELKTPLPPKKPKKSKKTKPGVRSGDGPASSSSSDSAGSSSSDSDSDLPINNIVDEEEWRTTGCYFPPERKRPKRPEGRKISKPRLKAAHAKKAKGGSKGASSGGAGKEGRKAGGKKKESAKDG